MASPFARLSLGAAARPRLLLQLAALCLMTTVACRRSGSSARSAKETPVAAAAKTSREAPAGAANPTLSTATNPLCVATQKRAFHLRAAVSVASKGDHYPAGTRLELLEHTELTRLDTRLFNVRVQSDAKTGYAFIGTQDLDPRCPLIWEDVPDAKRGPNAPRQPGGDCLVKNPVGLPSRDKLIRRSCKETGSEDPPAPDEVDLNQDGRVDALLTISASGQEYQILAVSTAAGWTGYEVGTGSSDADGAQSGWTAPIRTSSAVYASLSSGQEYDGGDDEPERTVHVSTRTLFRVRPDGALFEVWSGTIEGKEDDWTAKDAGNGSLLLVGKSGRTVHLRWDPLLWRLVPQRLSLKPQVP